MKHTHKNPLAKGEHFAPVNGITLHYNVAGNGPVMMVPSPGWGPSVEYIMPLTAFEEYFTVVYFDTRHSGKSTGPDNSSQYSLNHFIADIEGLRLYLGQQEIYLAGHSGAGHQVLEYAIQHAEHLLGLIVIDAIAATDALRTEEMSRRILKKKSEPFYLANPESYDNAAAFMMGQPGDNPPKNLKEIIGRIGYFYLHEPQRAEKVFANMELNDEVFAYTSASGFQGKNLLPELHLINVPTLVVAGDDDFICDPITQGQRIHDGIAGSKFVVISDCGHFPWIEQPAEFYNQCERWFAEIGLKKADHHS